MVRFPDFPGAVLAGLEVTWQDLAFHVVKSASKSAIVPQKYEQLMAASSHQPFTFLGSQILLISRSISHGHEEMVQRIGTRKGQLARRVA